MQQNWNYMCAECHSTNLRKNYDPQLKRFNTTWSEINVSCEACHGPGADHLAWANKEGDWQKLNRTKGLAIALDERRGLHFQLRVLAMKGLNLATTAALNPPAQRAVDGQAEPRAASRPARRVRPAANWSCAPAATRGAGNSGRITSSANRCWIPTAWRC